MSEYTYIAMTYATVTDELRAIFGVSDTELSDSAILSLTILPAAEMAVLDKLPSLTSITTLSTAELVKLRLGILYTAAANALPSIRMNVLKSETDSKTTLERFRESVALTEADLLAKAKEYLAPLVATYATSTVVPIFAVSTPAINVISGEENA